MNRPLSQEDAQRLRNEMARTLEFFLGSTPEPKLISVFTLGGVVDVSRKEGWLRLNLRINKSTTYGVRREEASVSALVELWWATFGTAMTARRR